MKLLAPLLLLTSSVLAQQQGVLTNGNSQLPSCAEGCQLLIQAAQACSGINKAGQQNWICFCQSAYLSNLRTSAVGVCDTACTNPTDNQQVSTWYKSNCGDDNGASEHADDGAAAAAPAATTDGGAPQPADTTATGAPAAAATAGSSSSGQRTGASSSTNPGDWWSNHYQWIIMLIILAIAFPTIAAVAVWAKRRHDRKRDQITEGFNAGITTRQPPMGHLDDRSRAAGGGPVAAAAMEGSGRDTPTRTRDAFMPYGYGYSHSESQLGSKGAVDDDHIGPVAKPPPSMSEDDSVTALPDAPTPGKRPSKRVLVREESVHP